MYTALMGKVRNAADLSTTMLKSLLKLFGFAQVAGMVDGGEELCKLLNDIKNGRLGDPNVEMIRSLHSVMHTEFDRIEAELKYDGADRKRVKQTLSILLDATDTTIRQLADDERKLLQAMQEPDSFADLVKREAVALSDNSDKRMQAHYERLLEAVAAEYLSLARESPRFNELALIDLLRCFPALTRQVEQFEQDMHKRFDKNDEDHQRIIELLKGHLSPIVGRLHFSSRPDVVAGNRFIKRGEQEQLNSLIADPTQQRTVLVGMRGCGKTQLAAALAKQCEDANWNLVAWVNASSTKSITSDLVELAKELKKELKIDTSDQPTPKTIIHRLFDRLKSADPSDRLIVFDNVEDINDLRGLVPMGDGLRVVVTTTNDKGWNYHGWDAIRIGVFDREKSIDYLLTVTESADRAAADTLADRLGDLPLALAQAAVTARNGDLSLARYMTRLDSYRSEHVIHPVPGDYYTDDVATALWMAIEGALENLAEPTRRSARRQLGALALLAESGVPTRWLDSTIEKQGDQELQGTNEAEDEHAHDALTELIHRSIVQQSADKATTMLHRLQAQAFRESWDENETAEAYESAAILLGKVDIDSFPRNKTDAHRRETLDLIGQLHAIGEQKYSQSLFGNAKIASSIFEAFSHAHDLGLFSEALTLEGGVVMVQELLGQEHPDTLTLLNSFAVACIDIGQPEEAIVILENLLSRDADFIKKENPNSLLLQNNLASAYQKAGHLSEAIALYEKALISHTPIPINDYPSILTPLSNLAAAYQAENHPEEAARLFYTVLDEQIRTLGPGHPDTLNTRSHFANAFYTAGALHEATELYEHILADSTRILGETHPSTLTYSDNLASAYEAAGRYEEAITLFEKTLKIRFDILGPEHPVSLSSHNNLARAFCAAGDFARSIDLYEQLIADTIRAKGEDSPDTFTARNDLAYVYTMAGHSNIASSLFMQVLEDRIRVLGIDHPETLASRNNLIAPFLTAHRPAQAVELLEYLLEDCLRILGVDHSLTTTVGENLEEARRELAQQKGESRAEESDA